MEAASSKRETQLTKKKVWLRTTMNTAKENKRQKD